LNVIVGFPQAGRTEAGGDACWGIAAGPLRTRRGIDPGPRPLDETEPRVRRVS
jgi:hypothetical protein